MPPSPEITRRRLLASAGVGAAAVGFGGAGFLAGRESAEANLRSNQAQARVVEENLNKHTKDYERMASLHRQQLESQSALDSAAA